MWFKALCSLKWFWIGCNSYTKHGFERNSAHFSPIEKTDTNKLEIIFTGASSGIGFAAVNKLAQYPSVYIHMVCSNEERGNQALQKIQSNKHPSSELALYIVDISDIRSVKNFTQQFVSRNTPIHVLVNNAGMLPLTYETAKNSDIEYSFALNVLGLKVLTEGLFPVLKDSPQIGPPRVITVTSGGALTECLNYDDPALLESVQETAKNFNGTTLYSLQKRQQIHLTEYWAEKHPQIHFMTMHPGWADTPGVQKSLPTFYKYMKSRLRTPEQGADTIVYLALHPEVSDNSHEGLLYFDRRPVDKVVSPSQVPTKEQIQIFVDKLNQLEQRFV